MNIKNQKQVKNPNTQKKFKKENRVEKFFSSDWNILLFLFVTTLIVYSNSFNVPFQFDDHNQISYREWYHSFDFFKNISNWFKINERPISFFTLTLNYVLHGEDVFGYHVLNFLIHLTAGFILYVWLKKLAEINVKVGKNRWFPIVVTLFFLLNPVQTQSVTYIIQRMSSLSGMFLILSVFLYTLGRIKHLKINRFKDGVVFYILSVVAGVLGVLSKQNVIVFPVIFLLVELFFIRNNEGKTCRKYLLTITSAGIIILFVSILKYGLPAETQAFSRIQYLATQMIVIPRYFQMMLFPIGLSIDHGVAISENFFNVWTILGVFILMGIIGFAVLLIKKIPLFSFGILWIFITLAIESSILPITDPMFDQRMYLPLAGFSIALWALVDHYVFQRNRNLIRPVIVSVLLLLSILTFARNNVWQSRIAIWEDVTQKYPKHMRGWMALGKMYREGDEKNLSKSLQCFEKAYEIDPENEENLMDLGFSYLENKEEEKAINCYYALLNSEDKVKRDQALKVLSAYNASNGRTYKATQLLKEIIAEDPSDSEAWKILYSLYFDKKDYQKAKAVSSRWLSKNTQDADANFYQGKSFFYLNEKDVAREFLLKAIQLNSRHAEAMMLYANTCVNKFEYDEAITYLEKAYLINKNSKIPENIALIKQLKIKTPKPN